MPSTISYGVDSSLDSLSSFDSSGFFSSSFFSSSFAFFSSTLFSSDFFSFYSKHTKKKIKTRNDTLMVIEEIKKRKREWLCRPRPLVLTTTEIRLLLWIFGSFYLCKCVWVLFRIYASIGSEPSNLKKPLILSSSNDVALKLTSLTTLL